jgi:hypothetical protein
LIWIIAWRDICNCILAKVLTDQGDDAKAAPRLHSCRFFEWIGASDFGRGNCRTADRPDEVLICQDSRLSVLDERMSSIYYSLRDTLRGAEREALVSTAAQRTPAPNPVSAQNCQRLRLK